MTTKDIVLNQEQPTTSNFQPKGLGETIFKQRYAQSETETWESACRRVATHVAKSENGSRSKWKADFTKNSASLCLYQEAEFGMVQGEPKDNY